MWVTIMPISSMWPANITRGRPRRIQRRIGVAADVAPHFVGELLGLRAPEPAGAASKDDGPGVSSRDLRKASDSGLMIGAVREVKGGRRGARCLPPPGCQVQL